MRIYRNAPDQRHDLSVVLDTSDIYGEDKMGRIFPDEQSLMMASEGIIETTAELWADPDVDLALGYLVLVKKPRVLEGVREAVTTTLSADAVIGDTVLSVADDTGFASGDQISIKSDATVQLCKVKSVDSNELTIYDINALESDFDAGSTVYACRFYQVIARRTPYDALGPYQVVTLKEIIGTAGML
ncbi:MAG: hypothetical protein JRI72_04380 [Deltaproteobacteria bacterium]|nr:hypothetical protein [Deltaproteobacteria bacterium]